MKLTADPESEVSYWAEASYLSALLQATVLRSRPPWVAVYPETSSWEILLQSASSS